MLGLLSQSPINVGNQNIGILSNLEDANVLKFPDNSKSYPFKSEDFQYQERIYAHKQSVVEKYLHIPSGHELAIKFIRIHYDQHHLHNQSALKELQTEIEAHQKVAASSSIVSFYGFCIFGDHILICMELMDMSLSDFYKWLHGAKIAISEEDLWHIIFSVIKAVEVCKENSIMHRDIKPLNILINSRGEIKLCDFGASRILDDSKASTFIGTVAYMPPERLTKGGFYHGFRSEIWSVGITILEFIMGKLPYVQNEENLDIIILQNLIKEYKFSGDKMLETYSENFKCFIESCLKPVEERPKLERIVNMEAYKRHENYSLSDKYYECIKQAIEFKKLSIINRITQLNNTHVSTESGVITNEKLRYLAGTIALMPLIDTNVPAKKHVKVPLDIKDAVEKARAKHGINSDYYNFGVAGHAKAGKSSLINAIRGIHSNEPGAAKVDVLERTDSVTSYEFPSGQFPNVRLYDIAGSGTLSHAFGDYYQDKALCGFDCLIILVQETLGEEEVYIAKTALAHSQNIVFVRSRCDLDFHKMNEGKEFSSPTPDQVKKHLSCLRTEFQRQFMTRAAELSTVKFFFVSAPSLRALVKGDKKAFEDGYLQLFEEKEFLDYIFLQPKKSHGIFV